MLSFWVDGEYAFFTLSQMSILLEGYGVWRTSFLAGHTGYHFSEGGVANERCCDGRSCEDRSW